MRLHYRWGIALLLFSAAVTVVLVASVATTNKTPGSPPPPPYPHLPSTGGWPEETLTLIGKLVYEDGSYELEVNSGHAVALHFATSYLETDAAAHLGQRVTVWGHWDSAQPSIFVVESIE